MNIDLQPARSTFILALQLTSIFGQMKRHIDRTFDVVNDHKRLPGNIAMTTTVHDERSCVKDCVLQSKCKSINVNVQMKQCELLDASTSENNGLQIQDAQGWTHYDYRPKDPNGICMVYHLEEVCCPEGWIGKYCHSKVLDIPAPTLYLPILLKVLPKVDAFTVCVRFYPTKDEIPRHIFNFYPPDNHLFLRRQASGNLNMYINSVMIMLTEDPFPKEQWHHICVSWYGENSRAHFITYQAGGTTHHKESSNTNALLSFPAKQYKISIGNDMDDDVIDDVSTFLGKIADWNFYTRKLSVDEVIAIFRGEKITKDLAVAWDEFVIT